jgi:hypothetical protein
MIAYRTDDPRPSCSCMDLYVERSDGTHRRRLVRGIAHQEFGPLYWARDDRTLVYTSYVQHGE